MGFVSLSGKAPLVSIPAAILFLRSWRAFSSSFLEKDLLNESMSEKIASCVSYLVYYYFIKYNEDKQTSENLDILLRLV